jgi:KDO2-lipid IV(A) lauroyltransferase
MLKLVLTPLAWLPLPVLHACGVLLGTLVYACARRTRERVEENVRASGLAPGRESRFARAVLREMGKGLLELPALWLRPDPLRWMEEDRGWSVVERALDAGRGVIFLTPHLGCWEIAAQHGAARVPITVMYRKPKLEWLDPLLRAGRLRGKTRLATADRSGVRSLLKALKSGETVGLLPDQAPSKGEGAWADFFGRPAYTMTLVGRLQQATGAALIFAWAERLPGGRGYRMHWHPLSTLPEEPSAAAREINAAMERIITECPLQYLWSYNRYKTPAGVAPPATA